jgi:hypothetical protein
MVVDLMRSQATLEAELLTLRPQINVLRRTAPKKQSFSVIDRLVFVCLYRLFPKVCDALAIVKPDTIVRWHRAGFRSYWRWKSRPRGGRPTMPLEIRQLIGEMSIANPLWGAPRIHGELLKLGIDIGQTSVAKYMAKRRGPPSQGWKTFLNNHADGIAAMDLFVVPTISFRLLYGLLIMGHGRRQILWFGVTSHPTAEWISNQLTEACGWEQAPRYLIAIGMGLMARSSSEGFDQWEFAIDRHRHVPHGKTDLLNDLSGRSDGSALTTLLCSTSGISVTCCCPI